MFVDEMIESASQLYALLREKDTLHLRRGEGRDDPLYDELKVRLGCAKGVGLERWLAQAGVSAQRFLQAFFAATTPLVEMYRDIYSGMKSARVHGASECARIKLDDTAVTFEVDLGDFMSTIKYLETRLEQRRVLLWDAHSVYQLTDVLGWLIDSWRDFRGQGGAQHRPHIAALPNAPTDPEVAEALAPVREVLEELARNGFQECSDLDVPVEMVLTIIGAFNEACLRLSVQTPEWHERGNALALLEGLPLAARHREKTCETVVEVFQHVLDLPLWKYRWYLYEVWAGFQLIGALREYAPVIHVDDEGRLALARARKSIVAHFSANDGELYELIAQQETPVIFPGRTGICPDYRLVRVRDSSSLILLECKQRGFFVGLSLETNMYVYSAGAPDSAVNLFVNYDAAGEGVAKPPRTELVTSFRPGQPQSLSLFGDLLTGALVRLNIAPMRPLVVLLDNSQSMADVYALTTQSAFLEWYAKHGSPPVHRFAAALEQDPISGDDMGKGWNVVSCSGGTDLGGALRALVVAYGHRVRVLVVTDLESNPEPNIDASLWRPSEGAPADLRCRAPSSWQPS